MRRSPGRRGAAAGLAAGEGGGVGSDIGVNATHRWCVGPFPYAVDMMVEPALPSNPTASTAMTNDGPASTGAGDPPARDSSPTDPTQSPASSPGVPAVAAAADVALGVNGSRLSPADQALSDSRLRASLSPSRAADFKTCPLLYRLRSIDRIPEAPTPDQLRGTLVHAVLEKLFDEPADDRTPATAAALVTPQWERLLEEEPELANVVPPGD